MPRTTISYKQWLEGLQREKQERLEAQALAHQIAIASAEDPEAPAENFFIDSIDVNIDIDASQCVDATANPAGALSAAAADDICGDAAALTDGLRDDPSFLPALEFFRAGSPLVIGDIDITPFTIPHDAADPCGFVFEADGIRIGFATDLGYMPPNVKLALRNCDMLLLESNHDLEMLRDGPYPWSVKQRVLSRVGHLSNSAAAEFLTRDYDGGAVYVVLAHLSESNNMPELARLAAEAAIGDRLNLLGNRILLAPQAEPMATLCL